jgi:hypothetical protein
MEITLPYWKRLKDPQWKEKQKTIFDRDKNKCRKCGCEENLHVHHGYYKPQADPWDYEDNTLWTLCEDCHFKSHEILTRIHRTIGQMHPDDYELLVPHLPEAVYEVTHGMMTREEFYTHTHPYYEYDATINVNPEQSETNLMITIKKFKEEFRGVTVDLKKDSGELHGTIYIFGPDQEAIDDMEVWFSSKDIS